MPNDIVLNHSRVPPHRLSNDRSRGKNKNNNTCARVRRDKSISDRHARTYQRDANERRQRTWHDAKGPTRTDSDKHTATARLTRHLPRTHWNAVRATSPSTARRCTATHSAQRKRSRPEARSTSPCSNGGPNKMIKQAQWPSQTMGGHDGVTIPVGIGKKISLNVRLRWLVWGWRGKLRYRRGLLDSSVPAKGVRVTSFVNRKLEEASVWRRPRLIALSHGCTASDSHSCRAELAFICDADIFDKHEQLWVACTVEQCSPHAATTCTSTLSDHHTKQTTCNATDNNLCHCGALSTSCNLAVSRVCILFSCSAPPLPIVVGSPSAALGPTWPQIVSLPSSLASRPCPLFGACCCHNCSICYKCSAMLRLQTSRRWLWHRRVTLMYETVRFFASHPNDALSFGLSCCLSLGFITSCFSSCIHLTPSSATCTSWAIVCVHVMKSWVSVQPAVCLLFHPLPDQRISWAFVCGFRFHRRFGFKLFTVSRSFSMPSLHEPWSPWFQLFFLFP